MKALFLTISIVLFSLTVSAKTDKAATHKTGALTTVSYRPVSVRTYYLKTSKNVCSYKDFVKAYKAGTVTPVKGYKLENGTFLQPVTTVYNYTPTKHIKVQHIKGLKYNRF